MHNNNSWLPLLSLEYYYDGMMIQKQLIYPICLKLTFIVTILEIISNLSACTSVCFIHTCFNAKRQIHNYQTLDEVLDFYYKATVVCIQNFCNVIKVVAEENIYFLSYLCFVEARFALSNFINVGENTIFHVNVYFFIFGGRNTLHPTRILLFFI